ncbi:MAG: hypothetical protein LBG11_09280 [Bifidobacteriaceae bacterium]|nr:hypothetical protein [Bifidobacteriaceae bacterium]
MVVIVVLVMSANSAKVAQEQARIAQEQQAAAAEFAAAMGELTVWHECFISDVEGGETWREEHGTEHGSVELRLGCAEGDVTGLLPILATGDGTENFGDFTRLDDGGAAILVVPEYRPGDDDRPMIFSGSYLFTYDFSIFDNGWIGGLVKPYARTADENDGTVVEYHAVGTIFPAGYAVTEFNGAAHSSCSFQVSQMEPRPAFCG